MSADEEDRAIVSLLSAKLADALDYISLPYYSALFPARQTAAEWIQEFIFKNEALPTKAQIRRHFPDVNTVQRPEPISYTFDQLRDSLVKETAVNANNKAADAYSKGNISDFIQITTEMTAAIEEIRAPVSEATVTPEDAVDQELAELRENPDYGEPLPSGITPYDTEYGGLEPGGIYVLPALINLGKTYVCCHVAEVNRKKGNVVLFYSLEMPKGKIAERISCVRHRLDADQYARHMQPQKSKDDGESRAEWRVRLLRELKDLNEKDKTEGVIHIIEAGEQPINPRAISRDIQRYGADLVIIDAAQDLRDNHLLRDRTPGLYRALSELNGVVVRHKVPVFLTVQMDPDVERKGLKKGNLTRIQWGQVFAQKADVVLTMLGDRTSPQRQLTLDKARDGSVGKQYELHMHFPKVHLEFLDVKATEIDFDDESIVEDIDALEEAIKKAESEVDRRKPPPRPSPDEEPEEPKPQRQEFKRKLPSRPFRRR